jgi:acyl-CoA synthetase (AMP-forming)/AMP-acid ligase II
MKIGAIPMPMNIRLTSNELISIFKNCNADGILYEIELQENVLAVNESVQVKHILSIQNAVKEASTNSDHNLELPIDPREVCEILFTSGTTGVPKGVMFNHERILAIAAAVSVHFHISNDDRMLTLMPLSHSAPLNTFFISGLYCGSSHIIGDYAPKTFLNLIHQEKATFSFAAPVAYLLSSKEPDIQEYDLSSMRVFAYGGGPLALASYQHVKNVFKNDNFYQVYGLTEAGPNGILLRPDRYST